MLPEITFTIIVLSLFIFGGNIKYTISFKSTLPCVLWSIYCFCQTKPDYKFEQINPHNVKTEFFFGMFLDKNNSQERVSFESVVTLQESTAQ